MPILGVGNSEWAEWEKISSDQSKSGGWDAERTERFLGTRWAVKEAAYKALYPRYTIGWKDLCLVKVEGGVKPRLVWEGSFQRALAQQEGLSLHCSITHDADLIAAYVVAEEDKRSS